MPQIKADNPKNGVSVVVSTNKPGFMENILRNFNSQLWPEKELIVILNNNLMNLSEWVKYTNAFISVYQLPEQDSLGACINFAVNKSKFNYIAKFDDDDYYAPLYLSEAMRAFDLTDADLVGKRTYHMYLADEKLLMLRHPSHEKRWCPLIAGGTIVAKKKVFREVPLVDRQVGTAIRFVIDSRKKGYRIYSTSRFNYTYLRRDNKSHTWNPGLEYFFKTSKKLAVTSDFRSFANPPQKTEEILRTYSINPKWSCSSKGDQKMRITVIGTGYVGLTSGTMFAELNHEVTCVDKDEGKIETLKNGQVPFFEPGLDNLIQKHSGRNLKFTTSLSSLKTDNVVMIAVGTPPAEDGSPDLQFVLEVVKQISPYLQRYKVILMKSTVPVGTSKIVEKHLLDIGVERKNFDIVSNPEFLREGSAVFDSFHPDRIVIGSDNQKAIEITRSLYQRIDSSVMITSNEAAEMIKYASNAFLATKISYINELAGICEEYKVDINEVARGVGMDSRIGPHFLRAGAGYGGSCLPKDLSGLLHLAQKAGRNSQLLKAVQEVNTDQPLIIVEKLEKMVGSLENKKIAVWGLTFKPNTDDMRFAPSISVIKYLLQKKAAVSAFDPVGMENAKKMLPAAVTMFADMYDAIRGCDALVIMTEWELFANADIKKIKSLINKPIIVDGRNIFSPTEMNAFGFKYKGVGR